VVDEREKGERRYHNQCGKGEVVLGHLIILVFAGVGI